MHRVVIMPHIKSLDASTHSYYLHTFHILLLQTIDCIQISAASQPQNKCNWAKQCHTTVLHCVIEVRSGKFLKMHNLSAFWTNDRINVHEMMQQGWNSKQKLQLNYCLYLWRTYCRAYHENLVNPKPHLQTIKSLMHPDFINSSVLLRHGLASCCTALQHF